MIPQSIRRTSLVALAACMLAAPSILSAEDGDGQNAGELVLQYGMDRLCDLADIVRIRGGIPQDAKAGGVKARATFLAQAGFVHFNGRYAGMNGRALGITAEDRTEGGLSALYGSKHETHAVLGNDFQRGDTRWSMVEDRRILLNLPYWDDGRGDLLGFGAEVATPLLAVDLGVSPSQAVDFVAGFLTIDPYKDDIARIDFDKPIDQHERTVPAIPDEKFAASKRQAKIDAEIARISHMAMEGEEAAARVAGEAPPEEALERSAEQPAVSPAAPTEAPAESKETVGDDPLTGETLETIDEKSTPVEFVPPAEEVTSE